MSQIKTFGVIGSGEFGPVVAQHLAPTGAEVFVFDKNPDAPTPPGAKKAGFTAVTGANVIVLAVPYDSYESLLPQLAAQSHPDSLIVDVCSVKMKPTASFNAHGLITRGNFLMTHPLFGPQTAGSGIEGKNLAVTYQAGRLAEQLLEVWQQKGVNIVEMCATKHDLEMAKVHVLTFFVGRTLLEMGIEPSPLNTPYYSELLDLVEVERHHSLELFYTIQRHNPFAAGMRRKFIAKLQELDDRILAQLA